jgi:hypothetical protein
MDTTCGGHGLTPADVFEEVCAAAGIPDGGPRLDVLLHLPEQTAVEILREVNDRLDERGSESVA